MPSARNRAASVAPTARTPAGFMVPLFWFTIVSSSAIAPSAEASMLASARRSAALAAARVLTP